ncbi:GAF domain-containing protein [Anaerolineales bacterium HSG25]|nr:GAF domain-containing protein [Anaerolineales bacterium HSG25]
MSASVVRLLQQENIRLKKEVDTLETRTDTLYQYFETVKRLYWSSQQIVKEENPLITLNELLYEVIDVIGARDGSLSHLDETTGELVFLLVHGDLRQQLRGYRLQTDTGIAGWVVNNQESLIVNDPGQDWRFSSTVDQEFHFLTQSIMTVPIITQGKLVGVSQLLNKKDNKFNEADVVLLLLLGQIAAAVLNEMETRIANGEAVEADFTDPIYEENDTPVAPIVDETTSSYEDPAFAELFLE